MPLLWWPASIHERRSALRARAKTRSSGSSVHSGHICTCWLVDVSWQGSGMKQGFGKCEIMLAVAAAPARHTMRHCSCSKTKRPRDAIGIVAGANTHVIQCVIHVVWPLAALARYNGGAPCCCRTCKSVALRDCFEIQTGLTYVGASLSRLGLRSIP